MSKTYKISNAIQLSDDEWNVLLKGIRDLLWNFDPFNEKLSKIYFDIEHRLLELEDEDA